MAELSADDERDDTHFWVFCPGCAYEGKIGVPHHHPADVVVCPICHQVVHIRPEDRVLWRPAEANEFLRQRFPHLDWDNIDREPTPPPVSEESPATVGGHPEAPPTESPDASGNQPAAISGQTAADVIENSGPSAERYRAQSGNSAAVWTCAAAAVAATLMTLVTVVAHRPPREWERRDRSVAVRSVDSRDIVDRDAAVNVNPLPPPIQFPPRQDAPSQNPPQTLPPQDAAPQVSPPATEPAPVAPPELAWRELYERAKRWSHAGNYADAVSDLDEVLRMQPNLTDALDRRAVAYFKLGRYAQALSDLNEELRRMPMCSAALISRAVVYEEMDNWPEAAADMYRAIRAASAAARRGNSDGAGSAPHTPVNILNHIARHAHLLEEERKYEEAVHVLSVLVRSQPGVAAYVRRRGWCYDVLGRVDEALADYTTTLSLEPGPAWVFAQRSMIYERKKDFDAAVIDMRKAVGLQPKRRDYIERLKQLETRKRYHPRANPARTRITAATHSRGRPCHRA